LFVNTVRLFDFVISSGKPGACDANTGGGCDEWGGTCILTHSKNYSLLQLWRVWLILKRACQSGANHSWEGQAKPYQGR